MNACLGCFAFMVLLVCGVMLMQAISPYWPIMLGLGLSWVSMKYIQAYYDSRDDP